MTAASRNPLVGLRKKPAPAKKYLEQDLAQYRSEGFEGKTLVQVMARRWMTTPARMVDWLDYWNLEA
jgi:hypothetical protein